jgi:hypothetical protein
MKKRVLLLSRFFPPETYAGANRVGPMADVLSKYYEVCVLTLKPSYPSPTACCDDIEPGGAVEA